MNRRKIKAIEESNKRQFIITKEMARTLSRLCAMAVATCNVQIDEFLDSLPETYFYKELQEFTAAKDLDKVVNEIQKKIDTDGYPTISEQEEIIFGNFHGRYQTYAQAQKVGP